MSEFFEKAVSLSENHDGITNQGRIFQSLAKYADEQYEDYSKTDNMELYGVISRHKAELAQCKSALSALKNDANQAFLEAHRRKLEIQLASDEAEYTRVI